MPPAEQTPLARTTLGVRVADEHDRGFQRRVCRLLQVALADADCQMMSTFIGPGEELAGQLIAATLQVFGREAVKLGEGGTATLERQG